MHLPPLTGCTGFDHRKRGKTSPMLLAGDQIYHRAAYFGVILAHHHGLRRSEFCDLATDDVIEVDGISCLYIRENKFRQIKNNQSDRKHALHPELVRLGFLDYVTKIRTLKYDMLFPDLVSPNSKSSMGDRFYDEMLPGLRQVGVTPHGMRHFFNNDLKQKGITEEIRQDFMGHKGQSESSNRYADELDVKRQLEKLVQVENVTAHLNLMPIRLLPWVDKKLPAPWARVTKRKLL
jgi:integrase